MIDWLCEFIIGVAGAWVVLESWEWLSAKTKAEWAKCREEARKHE